MDVLITGGAGFVGSALGVALRERFPQARVVALDNLRRRGSELNLARLRRHGITFVHGDVREPSDLDALPGSFDVLIDAAADPSVTAAGPYTLDTNLRGTVHCLEFAARRAGAVVFLSTSRVYSLAPLRALATTEEATRLALADAQEAPGASARGIREEFPTHLARSLYGASKLCSELIIQEYVAAGRVRAVINRCGVICGPGQFGTAEQGVFTLWLIHHHLGRPLRYTGFGGTGKQVRDLLHPADLADLVLEQLGALERVSGAVFNIGGGLGCSTSLRELTTRCQALTGREVPVAEDPTTSPVDIPIYISDCARAEAALDWRPRRTLDDIFTETLQWLKENEGPLADALTR